MDTAAADSRNQARHRAATVSAPHAPPVMEEFRAERLLGVGGSSRVWLVRHKKTQEYRALKVMCVDAPGSFHEAGRELSILRRLRHEHLIGVHGLVATDQGTGILMDYAAGDSLLRLVTVRGELPVGEVVTIVAPVAQALSYLHGASCAHGDVSPANILFTEEGKPLLGDLGRGQRLGEARGFAGGTPGFNDDDDDSARRLGTAQDIFALASVAWFALTGRVPGPSAVRVPLSLAVPDVPDNLLELLEAALAEDYRLRPSADDFARTVLRCSQAQPVDLVPTVHTSVLPDLRTRAAARQVDDAGHRRWRRPWRLLGIDSVNGPLSGVPACRRPSHWRLLRWPSLWAVRPAALSALGFVLGAALLAAALQAGPPGPDSRNPSRVSVAAASNAQVSARSVSARPVSARPVAAWQPPELALPQLAAARAAAFAAADPAILAHANMRGSPAMYADQISVRQLATRGERMEDLSVTLHDLRAAELPAGLVLGPTAGRIAALTGTAQASAYQLSTTAGDPLGAEAAPARQEVTFVLQDAGGGWLIHSVHQPSSG